MEDQTKSMRRFCFVDFTIILLSIAFSFVIFEITPQNVTSLSLEFKIKIGATTLIFIAVFAARTVCLRRTINFIEDDSNSSVIFNFFFTLLIVAYTLFQFTNIKYMAVVSVFLSFVMFIFLSVSSYVNALGAHLNQEPVQLKRLTLNFVVFFSILVGLIFSIYYLVIDSNPWNWLFVSGWFSTMIFVEAVIGSIVEAEIW